MERINRLSISFKKDILVRLLIILISIPLWNTFDMNINSYKEELSYYDNYSYIEYNYLNDIENNIYTLTDKEALYKLPLKQLYVYNNSNTLDNYNLVLKINKNDNINYDDIKVNINYDIKSLNSYSSYEDDDNIYYVLDEQNLVSSSYKYVLGLYDNNSIDNSLVNYEFIINS